MNKSGSLCPAVKAADIIGDKWVLLILRELFMGGTRYNDFERAIVRISPSVLSARLKNMIAQGLIIKKTIPGQKGTEYRLTLSGKELAPIIDHLARWGLRWARRRLEDEDIDVACFMWDFHRTLKVDELPEGDTVFCIQFPEQDTYQKWWLIANDDTVDLCTDNPGRDVDIYLSSSLITLVSIWMGDIPVKDALDAGQLELIGEAYLVNSAARWFPMSRYAHVRSKITI